MHQHTHIYTYTRTHTDIHLYAQADNAVNKNIDLKDKKAETVSSNQWLSANEQSDDWSMSTKDKLWSPVSAGPDNPIGSDKDKSSPTGPITARTNCK